MYIAGFVLKKRIILHVKLDRQIPFQERDTITCKINAASNNLKTPVDWLNS